MLTRRLSLADSPAEAPLAGPKIRIAIATQDMKGLNAHFGSARRFAVYDVSATAWAFVEALDFDDVSDESGKHKTEGDDRITPKVQALAGCQILFCLAIGGPSAAKVVSARIHPIKVVNPAPMEEVLERTRAMLAGTPPPWLRKLLAEAGVAAKPAFDAED